MLQALSCTLYERIHDCIQLKNTCRELRAVALNSITDLYVRDESINNELSMGQFNSFLKKINFTAIRKVKTNSNTFYAMLDELDAQHIKTLELSDMKHVTVSIDKFPMVEHLLVENCACIDLSSELPITHLTLMNTSISCITPAMNSSYYKNLKTLVLHGKNVDVGMLSNLIGCIQIERLELNYSNIKTLVGLPRSIKELDLGICKRLESLESLPFDLKMLRLVRPISLITLDDIWAVSETLEVFILESGIGYNLACLNTHTFDDFISLKRFTFALRKTERKPPLSRIIKLSGSIRTLEAVRIENAHSNIYFSLRKHKNIKSIEFINRSLYMFPNLTKSAGKLQTVSVWGNTDLVCMKKLLPHLPYLKSLNLEWCNSLPMNLVKSLFEAIQGDVFYLADDTDRHFMPLNEQTDDETDDEDPDLYSVGDTTDPDSGDMSSGDDAY